MSYLRIIVVLAAILLSSPNQLPQKHMKQVNQLVYQNQANKYIKVILSILQIIQTKKQNLCQATMGNIFNSVFSKLFSSNITYNILILGLANAGKTTLLYQMSLKKAVQTTPTIGSNVQEITHKNIKLSAWDLGGQERIRSIWSSYYTRTNGLIFVIDSTDIKNQVIAKTQLFKIVIHEHLKNVPILIFANKQDVKGAMSQEDITKQYSLHQIKQHSWHLKLCSALQGNGIKEGLDWLTDQLVSNNGK